MRSKSSSGRTANRGAACNTRPRIGLDWIGLACVLGGSRHADWEIMDEQGNKKKANGDEVDDTTLHGVALGAM